MGLGLYVMKKAVDHLGGTCEIQSLEKEFTEVRVRIPISGTVETAALRNARHLDEATI